MSSLPGITTATRKTLRELLDKNGLKCCGSHIRLDVLQGDELKKTVAFNQTIGNKYLIVAWMPEKYTTSLEACKEVARQYDDIAAAIKDDGMFVGYHAHAGDFKKIGDQFAWDLFFENTCKDVVMQLDLGNCVEGGGDPIATLKRFPGRSQTIHLKETGGSAEAVVGEGDVDWKQVFEICEKSGGTKWYIVEHERPAGTPLPNVNRCLQNLEKNGEIEGALEHMPWGHRLFNRKPEAKRRARAGRRYLPRNPRQTAVLASCYGPWNAREDIKASAASVLRL